MLKVYGFIPLYSITCHKIINENKTVLLCSKNHPEHLAKPKGLWEIVDLIMNLHYIFRGGFVYFQWNFSGHRFFYFFIFKCHGTTEYETRMRLKWPQYPWIRRQSHDSTGLIFTQIVHSLLFKSKNNICKPCRLNAITFVVNFISPIECILIWSSIIREQKPKMATR